MGHRAKLMRSMDKKNSCVICNKFAGGVCGTCKKNICRDCVSLHFARKHGYTTSGRTTIHDTGIKMPKVNL